MVLSQDRPPLLQRRLGQERASRMARTPQQFRLEAESVMQLQAARQPDEIAQDCSNTLLLSNPHVFHKPILNTVHQNVNCLQ